MSLQEQINTLNDKKEMLNEELENINYHLKTTKKELSLINRAVLQLEKLESELNGATVISE